MELKTFLKSLAGLILAPSVIAASLANPKDIMDTAVKGTIDIAEELDIATGAANWEDSEWLTNTYIEWLRNGKNSPHAHKFPWIKVETPTGDHKGEPYVCKTLKFKAAYSPELAHDLSMYNGIKAEDEMKAIMFELISMEMEAEYKITKKPVAIHKLFLAPMTYDKDAFTPRKSILISYSRINKI